MAKFRFELQALLGMREREERDVQLEVAKLEQQRVKIESTIRAAQDSIAACKNDLRVGVLTAHGAVDARAVRMQASASMGLQVKAQQEAIKLAGLYKTLDEARGRLLEATKARRALELLKERRFAAWKAEIARREAAEMDDAASRQAFRNRHEAFG